MTDLPVWEHARVHDFPPASSGQTICRRCGWVGSEDSGPPPATCLLDFHITFGVQYPREPHPTWPLAHHDGWVRISAPDAEVARLVAIERFEQRWSFLYDATDWNPEYFPLGELAHAIVLRSGVVWDQSAGEAKLSDVVVEVPSL